MSADEGVRAVSLVYMGPTGPVATAEADSIHSPCGWSFTIQSDYVDALNIATSCRSQRLEGITEAQAREALDRLGYAVLSADAVAAKRSRETTAAIRQAVRESGTPPLFDAK